MGKLRGKLVLLYALALASFSLDARAQATPGSGFEVVTPFVSGQDIPESVTTDDAGNLYFSVGNSIRRRAPSGEVSEFATLPLPIFALGVKVGPDGCVYNASTSLSEVAGAFVWRACSVGSIEVFAELDASGGPNDLAFDERGDLYVTDPVLGRVWRIDPAGNVEIFAESPLFAGNPSDPALVFRPVGVNGIAFDRYQHFLYLSNTDQGTILRMGMCAHNTSPTVFVQSPLLRGADGIAFDRSGGLFVAVNAQDALVSVSPSRSVSLLAQGSPLDAPSSVVFGATRADRHQLYVMSSAFSRTLGFQPGTPAPALLSRSVWTPGLRLP
ncbi:MAG: SMP-30/gluconolactonase/LRE family protein [Myxococcota bacterium]